MKEQQSIIPLALYQRRWVNDKSRFKIGVFTRQGGKSFATSLEAVIDCYERKTTWVFLSAGERQSKELIRKAKMHAQAIHMSVQELESDYTVGKNVYKMLEILFPNGSRIIGLPANPETAVGWSANILLDEFSKHKDSKEIWKAMFPTVTRGYKIRIISTFSGKKNKFFELFYGAPTLQTFTGRESEYYGDKGGWSKHFVNIHQAVDMGLELKDDEGEKCTIEELRLALSDDAAWSEDFECVPSDESEAFVGHDLITVCEHHGLEVSPKWSRELVEKAIAAYEDDKTVVKVFDVCGLGGQGGQSGLSGQSGQGGLSGQSGLSGQGGLSGQVGNIYLGFDIARKRDLSVIWVDTKHGSILTTLAVIAMKKFPFAVQEMILFSLLQVTRRACIDQSGLGLQLTERAQDKFGTFKVEGVDFTSGNKESLANELKRNFEDKKSEIPVSEEIRASIHSVKRYTTSTGHFRFDAERTDETGHADYFWAKALAIQAASVKGTGQTGFVGAGRSFTRFFRRKGVS